MHYQLDEHAYFPLAELPDLVLSETMHAIQRLLSFVGLLVEKAMQRGERVGDYIGSRFDKKILKNLGAFLGKQTVRKHKPVLRK